MTMRFTDRVALITAAGSGIGRATAEIIGGEGGIVVGVDSDEGRLKTAADAIRGAGGTAHPRRADALDAAQVDAIVAGAVRAFGRIDILGNAVGVTVNAIAPSLTLTERIRPRWNERTAEEQAQEVARTPLRRVAEARDQARVICFLASHDADFVTGVTIDVTGGV